MNGWSGRLMGLLSKVADILILNVVYLICCIPIITIGAATTALYYNTLKMADNTEGYLVKDFFKSFKQNFKQATIVWLIALAAGIFLALDMYLTKVMPGAMGSVFKYIFAVLGILYAFTVMYVFPLIAKFYNSTIGTIKNGLLMSIRHLPYTLVILIINAIPVLLFIFNLKLFLYSIAIFLMVGFALMAFLNSFLYKRIFAKYIPEETEEETL